MRRLLPLLLCPTLLLAACSKNPTELTAAGRTALGEGRYAAAEGHFREALDSLGTDTTSKDYLSARIGLCESLAAQNDAGKAKAAVDEFLALSGQSPQAIDASWYYTVASKLGDANHTTEAITLLGAGLERFPDSDHLTKLRDRLGKEAEESGDSGALDTLKGLGYVGD
jgi:tetratricopeptide (TPR) repeat protein